MLLRLERYPCRINYANGILEARVQRYRHLKKLLVGGNPSWLSVHPLTSFRSLCLWTHPQSSSLRPGTTSK